MYVRAHVGGSSAYERRFIGISQHLAAGARRWSQQITDDRSVGLDIIFRVPGPVSSPGFEGPSATQWSRNDRIAVVEIGLPEEMPDDLVEFTRSALAAVIPAAQEMLRKRGAEGSFEGSKAVIDRLCISLSDL